MNASYPTSEVISRRLMRVQTWSNNILYPAVNKYRTKNGYSYRWILVIAKVEKLKEDSSKTYDITTYYNLFTGLKYDYTDKDGNIIRVGSISNNFKIKATCSA